MTTTTATSRPSPIRLTAVMGLAAAMVAAAVALALGLPSNAPAGSAIVLTLPMIIAVSAVGELASIDRRLGGHNHTLSLSETALAIGLAFAAPTQLIVGRVLGGLVVYGVVKRIPAPKLVFNLGMFALENAVAATVFYAVLGTRLVHEPAAWFAMLAAIVATTIVGLGAVRIVLALHRSPQRLSTAILSLAISATATIIGILAVVALSVHTEAAVLVAVLCAGTFAAMRTIDVLLDQLTPRT